jgi:phage tail-like protein
MTTAIKPEPITASRLSLMIGKDEIASFSELLGIISEMDPAEYVESSDEGVISRQLLGKPKPPIVVLRRAKSSKMELWTWHESARTGAMAEARKTCQLTMYNAQGKPAAAYVLRNAWPSKLEVSASRDSREVMYETVTLTCDAIQRVEA